ncbi:MAG: diguanylate cyclase [Gammaproteobacteria bacterium]|nr:diguanylate cyclase [Gammaproteobacteria bacterium]MDH3506034.1 diguanylate cyclase [Gammaproteobacteria bacterium]
MKYEARTLHSILDEIVDALITIDTTGKIETFNKAAEALFGYERAEAIGKNVSMLMPEPYRGEHDGYIRSFLETNVPKVIGTGREVTALDKDGREIPVELSVAQIEAGKKQIFVGTLRDVSHRVTSMKELAVSHSMLDNISRIQSQFILDGDSGAAFDALLEQILLMTESEYGFIGEIKHNEDGTPFLRTQAITNIAWNDGTRKFYEENAPTGMEFFNLKTLFGAVMVDGKPVIANDARNDSRSGGIPPGHPALDAFLGMPFHIGQRLAGMIGIANRPGGYDDEIMRRLEPLLATCGNLVGALESVRQRMAAEDALRDANERLAVTVEQMTKRNEEVMLLSKLEELMQACDTHEEAYQVVAYISRQLFPGLSGAFYGIEESSRRLQLIHNWGGRHLASVFSTAQCIAIRRGRPHMSAGLGSPLNCAHVDTKANVSLCVPLIGKSESFGVLELIAESSDEGRQSLEDVRELVVTVAQRIAVTFANLKLSQYFREQSVRDPLTNLYNRRYMNETLDRELHRAARTNDGVVSVVQFDLDYFKQVNDRFGHGAGDAVLVEFAAILQEVSRASDVACRLGGEEFLLILPDCPIEIAVVRAEKIRTDFEALVCAAAGVALEGMTVSGGVAAYPGCARSSASLLRAADAALYEAKSSGRNCIRQAAPTEIADISSTIRSRALSTSSGSQA